MTDQKTQRDYRRVHLERKVIRRDFGRLLTQDEIVDAIAATGETLCSACGTDWKEHHLMCEGSEGA